MNTFLAMKNTFANQIYDYCTKNIRYEAVKDIVNMAKMMFCAPGNSVYFL